MSRWLRRRAAAGGSVSMSIVGCVYERTDAALFRATAKSIAAQTHPEREWVLLAQGELSPELRLAVREAAADPRTVVLDSPQNLGIVAGLRRCLEAARGDYVVPVDTDDLVEPALLARLADEVAARGRPGLVFSDEDALEHGVRTNPWRRPGWDPLLCWSTSYVWHACAFDRARALELGVWSDAGANWCQDWDTLLRFAAAGQRIEHLPEILYHWRAHAGSQTHQENPAAGSVASQRHALQSQLARTGLASRCEVVPFPIARGGPTEWWLRNTRTVRPRVSIVVWGDGARTASALATELGELRPRIRVTPFAPERIPELAHDCDLAVFVAAAVRPLGAEWPWEAQLLFELVPDLALLSPRLVDAAGRIAGGGSVFGFGAPAANPYAGLRASDGGGYALALKHRTVSTVPGEFFVARGEFARALDADSLRGASFATLGTELGVQAARAGRRVGQSPLIDGGVASGAVLAQADRHERGRLLALERDPAVDASRGLAYRRLLATPAARTLWPALLRTGKALGRRLRAKGEQEAVP